MNEDASSLEFFRRVFLVLGLTLIALGLLVGLPQILMGLRHYRVGAHGMTPDRLHSLLRCWLCWSGFAAAYLLCARLCQRGDGTGLKLGMAIFTLHGSLTLLILWQIARA